MAVQDPLIPAAESIPDGVTLPDLTAEKIALVARVQSRMNHIGKLMREDHSEAEAQIAALPDVQCIRGALQAKVHAYADELAKLGTMLEDV